MRLLKAAALSGAAGALVLAGARRVFHTASDAQKTAEGLDKIYEEPAKPSTPAELEAFLQDKSRDAG